MARLSPCALTLARGPNYASSCPKLGSNCTNLERARQFGCSWRDNGRPQRILAAKDVLLAITSAESGRI